MWRKLFTFLCVLCVLCGKFAVAAGAAQNPLDPFAPYLDERAPAIVREINDGAAQQGSAVTVRRVVFKSRTIQTKEGPQDSLVYAVIARPKADGTYPGMLVLHGGKGCAEEAKAVAWAARGYIAVAPDLPGIADPEKIPNSTGPWKLPYGAGRWIAEPDVTKSVIFDGELAAVQSLYLLRSQPEVMRDRIGVVGVSWGGYTTAMVCGLTGSDVKAAFALYGCGFYDREPGSQMGKGLDAMPDAQRQRWLTWLDAGRRAGGIKAAYFIGAASNDIYFYPSAVNATLAEIASEKNQVYSPNSAHQLPVPGGTGDGAGPANYTKMEIDYFGWQLKGEGKPFPTVTILGSPKQAGLNGTMVVRFAVEGGLEIQPPHVYYSIANAEWPMRKWEAVPATSLGRNTYEAGLPFPAGEADWFALVSDTRSVSVSSPMEHYPARLSK